VDSSDVAQVPLLLQDPGPVLQLHRVQQEEARLWQGALAAIAPGVSGFDIEFNAARDLLASPDTAAVTSRARLAGPPI
jgi:hypothetical protein